MRSPGDAVAHIVEAGEQNPQTMHLGEGGFLGAEHFIGSANGFGAQDSKDQRFGHITAVDADSGKVIWKYDTESSMVASVTPTAGGVVLTGDTKGNFLAFDAANGNVLLKKPLGDPIGGGIVTYQLGGIQYVAVAGGMKNPVVDTESGPAWVAILALPGQPK